MGHEALLSVSRLSKAFPGVQALDAVSLELREGEVHAIIGENGAGKSTLVKALSGVIRPDSGRIALQGATVSFRKPLEAIKQGICYVPQELSDFPHLTVAENVFAGKAMESPLGLFRQKQLVRQTVSRLKDFDMSIDPSVRVRELSTGVRQALQIVRTLSLNPKVLILDEPTTSLDVHEAQELFALLKALRKAGTSILYITHHLSELYGLVDRITVLRDGKLVATENAEGTSEEDLVRMMVGRDISDLYAQDAYTAAETRIGEEYFTVQDFSAEGLVHNVSFSLRRGEILGFFGLIGAGRTELMKSLLGVYKADTGSRVVYNGKAVRIHGMKDAIRRSIAYLPEDRKEQGLFLHLALDENLIAPQIERFSSRAGMLSKSKIGEFARAMQRTVNIVAAGLKQRVRQLSGGNQQKVLLGMWVGIDPHVLIVDEPTKGVDVGTKQLIYGKLREIADSGVGVILVSSDLPEVIQLSDRILVMHEGEMAGELSGSEAREESVMALATGVSRNSEQKGGR